MHLSIPRCCLIGNVAHLAPSQFACRIPRNGSLCNESIALAQIVLDLEQSPIIRKESVSSPFVKFDPAPPKSPIIGPQTPESFPMQRSHLLPGNRGRNSPTADLEFAANLPMLRPDVNLKPSAASRCEEPVGKILRFERAHQ
jgi:hypothetical protein